MFVLKLSGIQNLLSLPANVHRGSTVHTDAVVKKPLFIDNYRFICTKVKG